MPRIHIETFIAAPPERCFDLSRDVSFHTDPSTGGDERAVAGVTSGLLGPGDEVTFEARHLGRRWRMTSKIVEFDRPARFVDAMQRGPFKWWRHVHRLEARDAGTLMVDEVDYAPPLWPLSRPVELLIVRGYMRRMLVRRDQNLRRLAEAAGSR